MIILKTLLYFIYALEGLLLIRIIMSWLPMLHQLKTFLHVITTLTETFLAPIRLLIKKSILGGSGNGLMLDYSPFVALLIFNTFITMLKIYIAS